MAADQAKVAQLTAEDAKASGSKKDELDGELNLAKAQLELDQDEVDDGKEDLGRAGGDQQARIQALTQEHEAASQISDNTHVTVTAPNERHGLIHHFQQWSELHWKQMQLWRAKGDAESAGSDVLGEARCLGQQNQRTEKRVAGRCRAYRNREGTALPGRTHRDSALRNQRRCCS